MAAKKRAPAKRTTSGSGSSRAGEAARNGKGSSLFTGTKSRTNSAGVQTDVQIVNGRPDSYTQWDTTTGKVKGRGKYPLK